MIKNAELFRNELEKVNGWWVTGKVREAEQFPYKREKFSQLIKEIESRRISIILGARRVGKSVLLKHIISYLLKSINPRNIIYLSLDDPSVQTYSDSLIKDSVEYFLDNIAKEGRKYVFLDEVQSFEEWYKWIKAFYDKDLDIKFFLSGSSSLSLQKEANKYLRGRSQEIELFPLSFYEFLKLKGIEIQKPELQNILKMDNFEVKELWHKVKESFNEYLLAGGFPEWFETKKDPQEWFSRLINDVPKKAIYEDVANLFGIKNTKTLELILAFIAANQSRILAYETINEIVKLDHQTLTNYIEFLKSSYLIVDILKYASLKHQLKAKRKYLIVDQGLRNAILKDYEVSENNIGFIIENLVGISLYIKAKEKQENVFYISNGEVDFVVKNEETVLVEVKYQNQVSESDTKNMLKFMEKLKVNKGILVTKDALKEEIFGNKKILFIPTWLFLLAL